MIYLLDTDTFIHLVRGLEASAGRQVRERARELVEHCRQAQADGHAVGLSAITDSELEFGARKSGRYEEVIEAIAKLLTPFEVYDFDAVNCAAHYGHVRNELELAGQSICAMDLLVAGHALGLAATLVTNNLVHFWFIRGKRTSGPAHIKVLLIEALPLESRCCNRNATFCL